MIWECGETYPKNCEIMSGLMCYANLQGKHLRCSDTQEVKSVFLPLGDKNNNHSLSLVVTVKNENNKASATLTTQVCALLF